MILLLKILFYSFYYILLARVLMSWFPYSSNNKLTAFVFDMTEPVLAPIRNLIPATHSGLDFSPLILFIILNFLKAQLLLIG
tara:strand:+ start:122 stop:367 length:246 start_codon:yes stop_codon:yes gene_type:complete